MKPNTFAKSLLVVALVLGGTHTLAACSGGDVAIGDADDALKGKDAGPANDAGPDSYACPDLLITPGFCPGGKVTQKADAHGCKYYDCEPRDAGPAPDSGANACVAAGGTCEALTPANNASCPRWGDANQFSCGGGVGVGCCLPSCPDLIPPPPGFCDGGSYHAIVDATGCTTGFACGGSNDCTNHGGTCKALVPGNCTTTGSYSCGGGVGVECCLD